MKDNSNHQQASYGRSLGRLVRRFLGERFSLKMEYDRNYPERWRYHVFDRLKRKIVTTHCMCCFAEESCKKLNSPNKVVMPSQPE